MELEDILAIIRYYFLVTLLGVGILPISLRVFKRLPDRGWIFYRPLGLLFFSWIAWWIAALKIALISPILLWSTFIAAAAPIWWFNRKFVLSELADWKQWRFHAIASEILFAFVFFVWIQIRAINPDIVTLEKFMDYGFILSILRGGQMPPLDHFLSGETINYYYYGHYMTAALAHLGQFNAGQAYNLMMTLIFANTTACAFSTSLGLYWIARGENDEPSRASLTSAGLLGSFFVALSGNFHAFYYKVVDPAKFYWYADATRFIKNTIHEFPAYTPLTNDLHGHVINLPYAVILLIVVAILFCDFHDEPKKILTKRKLFILSVTGFLIGSSYVTNAWDLLFYDLLTGSAIWVALVSAKQTDEIFSPLRLFHWKTLLITGGFSAALLGLPVLFFAPYWYDFVAITKNLEFLPPELRSTMFEFWILWGVQMPYALTTFLPTLLMSSLRPPWRDKTFEFFSQFWDVVGFRFLSVLAVLMILMVVFPEFLYFKDIYSGHPRANTLFKFYFANWIWAGHLAAMAVMFGWRIAVHFKKIYGWILLAATAFSITAGAWFFPSALPLSINTKESPKPLHGKTTIKAMIPDYYDAIDWMNRKVEGQPTLIEAGGNSYTQHAMMASMTGVPSVIGWTFHEWLWRGSWDKRMRPDTAIQKAFPNQVDSVLHRLEDVKRIYEAPTPQMAAELLKKYKVHYVIVGPVERNDYKALNENNFRMMGLTVAYQDPKVTIYRTPINYP